MFKLRITLDREGLVQVDLEHSSAEERDIAHRFYEKLRPFFDQLDRAAKDAGRELDLETKEEV